MTTVVARTLGDPQNQTIFTRKIPKSENSFRVVLFILGGCVVSDGSCSTQK